MENVMTNGFAELSANEMYNINGGGDPVAAFGVATAFISACGAALIGGFKAGRSFVRDVRNKFFNWQEVDDNGT